MERANTVRKHENDIGPMTAEDRRDFAETAKKFVDASGPKENPADTAAGLSNDSDQADWYTGEDLVAAIRVIIQAQNAVENVKDYGRLFDKGRRTPESFDEYERKYLLENLRNAEIIYRELYRTQVRMVFRDLFSLTIDEFEDHILTLKSEFGGE